MKIRIPAVAATVLAIACLSGPALAQERHEPGGHETALVHAQHLQLDQRYHHDHYYPPRGYAVAALPHGSIAVGYGGGSYYYHAGVWFAPVGGRFVVALPPIGIVVPLLPPAYATLWIGGTPYYYANGVYYAQAPGQDYTVVAPPPGAEVAQPLPAAQPPGVLPAPIIYPRSGRNAVQTETDRQDCAAWASAQPHAMADAQVLQRGLAACMDARGYTLR
jgi:hypothetical protein